MSSEKSIAFLARTEEDRMLLAHTEDLLLRSAGGIAAGEFLNLGEQYLIRAYLTQCGKTEHIDYAFFGGYPSAERRMLFLFPSYLSDTFRYFTEGDADTDAVCAEEERICALRIQGSGYRVLTHRDYLGSLLALGIERSVIGDIAVLDEHSSVLFVKSVMAEYLFRTGAHRLRQGAHIAPVCRRSTSDAGYTAVGDDLRHGCFPAARCPGRRRRQRLTR